MRNAASRRTAVALCATGVGVGAAAPAAEAAFRNAIVPAISEKIGVGTDILDTSSPDPWLQTFRGRYYMTYSRNRYIEIRSASEIGGLAGARAVRVWPPRGQAQPAARASGFWAPEFHRLRGPNGVRWYVYTAAGPRGNADNQQMHVLESVRDSPLGPYRYKGRLDLGRWAIDATVAQVRGRLYVFYAGRAVRTEVPQQMYLAPLRNPWTVGGRSLKISEATYDWERTLNPINEAPEILMHRGRLHVIYSASWCLGDNYKLGRLTVPVSADLLDPATWARAKAPEPVLQSRPGARVFGPGHNGFFKSPDGREDWIVYHATSRPGVGCFTGGLRVARAERFTYDRRGNPVFGPPVALERDLRAPSGDPTLARQLEDAPVLAARGARARRVRSPLWVGERASAVRARGRGGAVTYAVDVPARGTFRIVARVGVGPRGARVRLDVGAPGARRLSSVGAQRDLYARRAAERDVDLGRTVVRRPGRHRLRLVVAGRNASARSYEAVLDQVRFVRAGR